MRVIELLYELARRVVNDGRIAPRIYLVKHLSDYARFAGTRVADDEEMFVFGVARDAKWLFSIICFDPDSRAGDRAIESLRIHQNWAFEPAPVPEIFDSS